MRTLRRTPVQQALLLRLLLLQSSVVETVKGAKRNPLIFGTTVAPGFARIDSPS